MSFEDFENFDFGDKDEICVRVSLLPLPKHIQEDAAGEEDIDVSELRDCAIFGTYDCPICLDIIKRPRILICGHIYCRLCILKIVELGNRTTVECPVCRVFCAVNDIRIFDLLARSMKDSLVLLGQLKEEKKKVKII